MTSRHAPTPQPGDRLIAAIEAQTVAIGRAMDHCALTLLGRCDGGRGDYGVCRRLSRLTSFFR